MSSIQCLSTTAAKSTASCATFVIIGNFTSRRRFCSIYARPDRRRKQNAIINDSVTIAQRNHHAVCSLSLSQSNLSNLSAVSSNDAAAVKGMKSDYCVVQLRSRTRHLVVAFSDRYILFQNDGRAKCAEAGNPQCSKYYI